MIPIYDHARFMQDQAKKEKKRKKQQQKNVDQDKNNAQ